MIQIALNRAGQVDFLPEVYRLSGLTGILEFEKIERSQSLLLYCFLSFNLYFKASFFNY
jgi:hypothetical protein